MIKRIIAVKSSSRSIESIAEAATAALLLSYGVRRGTTLVVDLDNDYMLVLDGARIRNLRADMESAVGLIRSLIRKGYFMKPRTRIQCDVVLEYNEHEGEPLRSAIKSALNYKPRRIGIDLGTSLLIGHNKVPFTTMHKLKPTLAQVIIVTQVEVDRYEWRTALEGLEDTRRVQPMR